jgi:hypothetical protein
VNATEIETGTGTERENGKERPVHQWPFPQVLFSKTSVNVIVWKARSIIVIATANVIVQDLARIILHSQPLRPSLSHHVKHVVDLHHRVGGLRWNWTMSASGISITRGCDNNTRGTEIGIGKGKGKGIHERRKPINVMGWVIFTQLFQHPCHASLMTGLRMWATLTLR